MPSSAALELDLDSNDEPKDDYRLFSLFISPLLTIKIEGYILQEQQGRCCSTASFGVSAGVAW